MMVILERHEHYVEGVNEKFRADILPCEQKGASFSVPP